MTEARGYKTIKDELDTVVDKIQASDADIDESIALYKQAKKLTLELEDYLENTKNEIEHLRKNK